MTPLTSKRTAPPPAQKEGLAHAIGASRGGRTTKIHALTDEHGRPRALVLTADLVGADEVLRHAPMPKRLLAGRAYDARKLRDWLASHGAEAVIPPNPMRMRPLSYDINAYRGRNLIGRMFCRLKDFRRIATRYGKRAPSCRLSQSLPRSSGGPPQLSPEPCST